MSPSTRSESPFVRPVHYGYSLTALLKFPSRMMHPPPAPSKTVTKTWSLKPFYHVNLEEILDKKHLSPLGLKDFEEYLMFNEHSVENLYFIMWLREYIKSYEAWSQHRTSEDSLKGEKPTASSPASLSISWFRAQATFFDPSGHLELNLPAAVVAELVSTAAASKNLPSPETFARVRSQVEAMLTESLSRFIRRSCNNAGTRRGLFALAVSLLTIGIGLLPFILSIIFHNHRWLRIAGLVFIWLGIVVGLCGLQGMCILIFMFGDARQLYPYELARPKLPSLPTFGGSLGINAYPPQSPTAQTHGLQRTLSTVTSLHSRTDADTLDLEAQKSNLNVPSPITLPKSLAITVPPRSYTGTEAVPGLLSPPLSPLTPRTPNITAPLMSPNSTRTYTESISASATLFDFDSIPDKSDGASEHGTIPTWGPLTTVLSPIVSRTQWDVVFRSMIASALITFAIEVILVAVPVTH